eukprot:53670-Eustigmatos_ZCMA.PRE.1
MAQASGRVLGGGGREEEEGLEVAGMRRIERRVRRHTSFATSSQRVHRVTLLLGSDDSRRS